jgi:hypothetical protein
VSILNNNLTGIYTLNQLVDRKVLRLAPDCLVTFNGSSGFRIGTSPGKPQGDTLDLKSGITGVSVQSTVNTPGQGSCTVNMVTPQYEGSHDNYYVENPDGTKNLFFQPMMEVRVYMKGRFMGSGSGTADGDTAEGAVNSSGDGISPRYYQVFWGFITNISESFSGMQTNITLTCRDMLHWWNWQKQVLTPGTGPIQRKLGSVRVADSGFGMTVLHDLNPWEIIYKLFNDTDFDKFVLPNWSNNGEGYPLDIGKVISEQDFIRLAKHATSYWQNNYGMGRTKSDADKRDFNLSFLEMFGLIGRLDLRSSGGKSEKVDEADKNIPKDTSSRKVNVSSQDGNIRLSEEYFKENKLSLDFNVLAKVQPFLDFSKNTVGLEPNYDTKLAIAQKVASDINYEFYMDTNGSFVFKPPFYNMDTKSAKVYRFSPGDIININENIDSENIVNYLEVSGPTTQTVTTKQALAFHVDFNSIARFGIRHQTLNLAYGSTTEQLQGLAVGQMSMINAKTTTASLEAPLRPELRMGYPIYIDHMDAYYYVTGINHNFTFGSTATTSLTLEAKRTRVRDAEGKVMSGFIYKEDTDKDGNNKTSVDPNEYAFAEKKKPGNPSTNDISKKQVKDREASTEVDKFGNVVNLDESEDNPMNREEQPLDKFYREAQIYKGLSPGPYRIVRSKQMDKFFKEPGSNVIDGVKKELGTPVDIANELVQYTKNSVPYTDVNGYNHIGAFPYGANIRLDDTSTLEDIGETENFYDSDISTKAILNAGGVANSNPLEKRKTEIAEGVEDGQTRKTRPASSDAAKSNKQTTNPNKASQKLDAEGFLNAGNGQ